MRVARGKKKGKGSSGERRRDGEGKGREGEVGGGGRESESILLRNYQFAGNHYFLPSLPPFPPFSFCICVHCACVHVCMYVRIPAYTFISRDLIIPITTITSSRTIQITIRIHVKTIRYRSKCHQS